jgi:polysaccharide deacetylase family protein (PEP-CTERM system associated)
VTDARICNAMTVDVEDWFQVSAFERFITRDRWASLESRVERNTEQILGLFESHDVRATFFVLGWIAERHPALLRRISEGGHEVASHGWSHVRATEQAPQDFQDDVVRTRALLEDATGTQVRGYRAASFSIGRDNLWAFDCLREAGYEYSSSIYPVQHDLYGMPEAPRFPFRVSGSELLEIPVTTVALLGRNLPCGGGGYFRLLPYAWFRWAIGRVNRVDGWPAVFYFHPWEVDPDQPRQRGLSLKSRFRHYTNLSRTEGRLHRLLGDFRWGRMDSVYLAGTGAGAEPALDLRALNAV